jgi:hypothetical protein
MNITTVPAAYSDEWKELYNRAADPGEPVMRIIFWILEPFTGKALEEVSTSVVDAAMAFSVRDGYPSRRRSTFEAALHKLFQGWHDENKLWGTFWMPLTTIVVPEEGPGLTQLLTFGVESGLKNGEGEAFWIHWIVDQLLKLGPRSVVDPHEVIVSLHRDHPERVARQKLQLQEAWRRVAAAVSPTTILASEAIAA